MKRATRIAIGVATAFSLGMAAAVVNAHPYGNGPGCGTGYGPGTGMGPMMGGMGAGPMRHGMGPQASGEPGAAAEGRLAGLKAELKITPDQETAWQAYTTQAKARIDSMQASMAAMHDSAPATAPDRLARRDEIMKQHWAQREAVTAAFKDLYAALTPEQKTIADQRVGGFGPMAGPGSRGGPGGRWR